MPGQTVFTGDKFIYQDDSQADQKDLKDYPEAAYGDQEIDAWLDAAKSLDDLRAATKRLAKIAARAARLAGGVVEEQKAAESAAAKVKAAGLETAKEGET